MQSITVENFGRARVRFTGIPLPEFPKVMRALQREALADTVAHWRDKIGPGHFETSAYARYGGREQDVYTIRRARRGQLKRPLVKTGNLRTAFLNGTMNVRASGEGDTLKAVATWPNLPRYTYIDKHGRKRVQGPKKYDELTILTEGEVTQLVEFFATRMQQLMDAESAAMGAAA